jgi:hypothetical protein
VLSLPEDGNKTNFFIKYLAIDKVEEKEVEEEENTSVHSNKFLCLF